MSERRVKVGEDTEDVVDIRATASHPDCAALMQIWQDKTAADGFVMGRDIPSRELARFLPGIMILEPTADFSDYLVRLAGTRQRKTWNQEITGMKLSGVSGAQMFQSRMVDANRVLYTGVPLALDITRLKRTLLIEHRESILLRILAPDCHRWWIMVFTAYYEISRGGPSNGAA